MASLTHEIKSGKVFKAIAEWKDTKYRTLVLLVIAETEEEAYRKVDGWILEQHPSLGTTDNIKITIIPSLILQ